MSRSIDKVDSSRSRMADQVMQEIRELVVSGIIPKGAKLPTEREWADRFGVSVPTVREAVKGLVATGLIVVRQGSGAYVTADSTSLLATSLSNVIQIERLTPTDVLDVTGGLIIRAARLAATNATNADKARIFEILGRMDSLTSVEVGAETLRGFHEALAAASHNPLLATLYDYCTALMVNVGKELMGDSLEAWRDVFDRLKPLRQKLGETIAAGDVKGAMRAAEAFHDSAITVIMGSPNAKELRLKDPLFASLLVQTMKREDGPD